MIVMRDTRIHLYPVEVCSLEPQSRFTGAERSCGAGPNYNSAASHLRTRSTASRSRSLLRPILVLSCRAHDGACRNNTVFDKAPECNRELANQGDNADLANPRTVFTAGAPIPFGQHCCPADSAATPGQLHEERACRLLPALLIPCSRLLSPLA